MASGAARWTAAGALVLAVAGAAWWNERSNSEALLAEIEVSRVSKRPLARPAPGAGNAETAALLAKAADTLRMPHLMRGDPGEHPTWVSDNAAILAILDEVASRGPCVLTDDSLLRPDRETAWLPRLLEIRGEAEIVRGDLSAAIRTARALRVLARSLGTIERGGFQPRVGMLDIIAEMHAVKILESVAVHPSLDGTAAAELEAALAGPFALEGWIRTVLDCEDWFDRTCLWALGPEAKKWAADPTESSGIDDDWDRLVRDKGSGGKVPLPSWREVRRMRAVAAAVADAAGRNDIVALAPGGALDRAFEAGSKRPLGLGDLGVPGPGWFRMALGWQCRVAVLRGAAGVAAARIRDGRLPAGIDRVDPLDGKPLEFLPGPGNGFAVRSRCWPDDEGRPVELRATAR